MKKVYINSIGVAISAFICLALTMPANAQSKNNNSSGGGGSGSTSGSSARPSAPSGGGGGGGGSSAPRASYNGGGAAGVSRSNGASFAPQRQGNVQGAPRGNYGYAPRAGQGVGYAPRQGQGVGYVPRQGVGVTPRGNYGYAPRSGVVPGGGYAPRQGVVPGNGLGYRTAPAIGYGHGGYWRDHGYNHYNHGYYKSYYAPRLGFSIGILPYGYYPFYWGDYQYFYSDGLYYQYDNNQYTVVEPPVGAEITTLPDKAQSIVINGQQYYELNGVYYQPVTKDDGTVVYMIAGKDGELNTDGGGQADQPQGPQMGDIVVQLPPDCRKLKVNGQVLYVSPDGVYYQQQVDPNGNKTYKIVGLPSEEPDQNQ